MKITPVVIDLNFQNDDYSEEFFDKLEKLEIPYDVKIIGRFGMHINLIVDNFYYNAIYNIIDNNPVFFLEKPKRLNESQSKVLVLVNKLEKLSGKKITFQEGEITKQLKKHFYGVTADLEREAKRVENFFVKNLSIHPELKPSYRKFKRLIGSLNKVLSEVEFYLDSEKANILQQNQPELPFNSDNNG